MVEKLYPEHYKQSRLFSKQRISVVPVHEVGLLSSIPTRNWILLISTHFHLSFPSLYKHRVQITVVHINCNQFEPICRNKNLWLLQYPLISGHRAVLWNSRLCWMKNSKHSVESACECEPCADFTANNLPHTTNWGMSFSVSLILSLSISKCCRKCNF